MARETRSEQVRRVWRTSVLRVVIAGLREKLADPKLPNKRRSKTSHLQWRLAYNLYLVGDFEAAADLLDQFCDTADSNSGINHLMAKDLNKTSLIFQTAGRCSVKLFLRSQQQGVHSHSPDHSILARAYEQYQNAVETTTIDLFTMFKLPMLLLELGRVLEFYGAFEAAVETYTKILGNFPNFRGYFDAMYRSAIVGKHSADLLSDKSAKEETYNKCIDILQFLLEALPHSIDEVHIVMLFGRTLESCQTAQLKYRAQAIYQSLYSICRKHGIAGAGTGAGVVGGEKAWVENPETWMRLGNHLASEGEFLIAKFAYDKYLDEKAKTTKIGRDITSVLSPEACLQIANCFASFQNYSQAVKHAETALKIDHYHKPTRALISRWSQQHAKVLAKEQHAVRIILGNWKGRVWTSGFRERLLDQMVSDSEAALRENHWDADARQRLSYYARDKWRHVFLFEELCAQRIQRKFFERKKIWIWQETQRKMYYTRSTELYRQYNQYKTLEHRYNVDLRAEICSVARHRLAPQRHPIQLLKTQFEAEDKAISLLERGLKAAKLRISVAAKILYRQAMHNAMLDSAATAIQSIVRMKLAFFAFDRMLEYRGRCEEAAVVLQRYLRRRALSFRHSVTRIVDRARQRKLAALSALRSALPRKIKQYLSWKRFKKLEIQRRAKLDQKKDAMQRAKDMFERSLAIVQVLCRNWYNRKWARHSRRMFRERRHASFSPQVAALCDRLLAEEREYLAHFGSKKVRGAVQRSTMIVSLYRPPGVRQDSDQFQSLLNQETIFCKETFSPADCLMLSMLLRHPLCRTRTLVLFHVANARAACYEFDLLSAIVKNISLRSVQIVGGCYSPGFLFGLVHNIQVENPRIRQLSIERVADPMLYREDLCLSTQRLLMDYFNYSIPGLSELSLHGCNISDALVPHLAQGMAVNTSVRSLVLSLNLLTDKGFLVLMDGIFSNRKSALEVLDLSYNMFKFSAPRIQPLLDSYVPPQMGSFLRLLLAHNMIPTAARYQPAMNISRMHSGPCHLHVVYTDHQVGYENFGSGDSQSGAGRVVDRSRDREQGGELRGERGIKLGPLNAAAVSSPTAKQLILRNKHKVARAHTNKLFPMNSQTNVSGRRSSKTENQRRSPDITIAASQGIADLSGEKGNGGARPPGFFDASRSALF